MELRENTYEETFPLFEHAYFGKPYETRDGRKVIYINSNLNNHYLRDEDEYCIEVCSDGRAHYNDRDIDSEDDIISEWQDIDEKKLDDLAFYAEKETFKKSDLPFQTKWVDGFKAGYHKAKEMEKQVLSISQMQELNDLGIDTSKARMKWERIGTEMTLCVNNDGWCTSEMVPTFTLQDILSKLPRAWEIGAYNANRNTITVFLDDETGHCHREVADSLLEAAFNMLKWCKINNYI